MMGMREVAERIMAKLGPMDAQEQQTYDLLVRRPEEYVGPDRETGRRVCGVCGARFSEEVDQKGGVVKYAMEKFVDHQAEHNPRPELWAEANRRNRLLSGKGST